MGQLALNAKQTGSIILHLEVRFKALMKKGNNMVRCLTAGLAVCLLASSAFAAVTNFSATVVPGAPAGYVTTDLKATFTGQYTGAQLLTPVLAAGSIYQDAFGGAAPPLGALVGAFPTLAYDTFTAQGSATAPGAQGEPSLGGGAVDLGGPAVAEFSTSRINQAWNPAGGATIQDQNNFLLFRLTLKSDVNLPLGQLLALASAGGTPATVQASVVNGAIVFPPVGIAPIVADLAPFNTTTLGEVVNLQPVDSAPGTAPVAWTIGAPTYTPGFGAMPGAPGLGGATFSINAATGAFQFNTLGSTRGTYVFGGTAGNQIGSDPFSITVNVTQVPEPTTLALVGLALVGFVGFRRQK